jgi:hypothetical protein
MKKKMFIAMVVLGAIVISSQLFAQETMEVTKQKTKSNNTNEKTMVQSSSVKPTTFSVIITFGNGSSFCPGFGLCRIDFKSGAVKGSSDGSSQSIEVKGEIQNHMLVINLPEKIDEKGRNEQGKFIYSLSKEMVLGSELANEFGVDKLVIAPGSYEFKGNTVSFKLLTVGNPATGQSSGRKSDIAIDEQGVHKEAAQKATYDQKKNTK